MMNEAQGSSNTLPPFVSKTYEMVDDPSTNSIVSWSPSNISFAVWDEPEFSRLLLPKFFKHKNFSSFVRQLNTYGFRKVDHELWEFSHDDFVRGELHLLKNIHRRKPVHSHSMQNLQGYEDTHLTDSERKSLKYEIEKLKHDKEQLLLVKQRHAQERKMYEEQIGCWNDRLIKFEKKQQDMLSSISLVLQKPMAFSLLHVSENIDRKRRLSRSGNFDEARIKDPIGTSQVFPRENAKSMDILFLNMEKMDRLESYMEFWENIVVDISDALVQGHSNLDFDDSISCTESQAISSVLIDVNVQPKPFGIDINSEPDVTVVPDLDASKIQHVGMTPVATGVNDLFWEQFLTENPGSSKT
ncbi:hypothetical protein TanjilG_06592 [Lupinus angustifolius]|uniref:HSF-type DNA-binding domain-containing protein n=1 Tax=Lupinus angustifolius TaxID=3871 RepID=A0A394DJ35_LUPAN|nr:hypothetical protein TanjilG_06592 [Lupinus angustifolius]